MATPTTRPLSLVVTFFALLGDWADFALRTAVGLFRARLPSRAVVPVFFAIGVQSVTVVAVTGLFIGMVMAVQTYSTLNRMGVGTYLGSVVNVSVVKELGPVLAATMLAGRVGGAMAAELGTMRVTEQIDALACLGVNPIHYLSVPRFLACLILTPMLTVLSDVAGIAGSALIAFRVFGIEPAHYWQHSDTLVDAWDVAAGLIKAFFFGGSTALISCHRGFRSGAGSEGVGRAATEAFVISFIAILVLDFFLGLLLNGVEELLWPAGATLP